MTHGPPLPPEPTLDADPPPEPDFSALGPAFEVDPDPLGLGAFGSVHLATMSLGGALGRKVMCVKAISKQRTREQAEAGGATTPWQELLQREVDITAELGRTQHRHMPRFYGTADDGTYVLLALQQFLDEVTSYAAGRELEYKLFTQDRPAYNRKVKEQVNALLPEAPVVL